MQPTPKSLILDLLSTLRRGAMPVRGLVAAGALFGLQENSVRVALARLRAAGRVERDERGSYRLGRAARPIQRHVASWRDLEQRLRAWEGTWVAAHRTAPRTLPRPLGLLGFRDLAPGLSIRPDNFKGGVAAVREELGRLGLAGSLPVFAVEGFDAETEQRARGLWPGRALRSEYRRARRALERSARRLPGLARDEARVESFLVGGRVLRLLVLDPRLPEPIGPARERAALVAAMRDYDRLGRDAWSDFLERFGVPHRSAPLDTRTLVDDLGTRLEASA